MGIYAMPPLRNADKDGNYIPNMILIKERIVSFVISLDFLA
ncbi:hypothetical protein GPLA_2118 [Paraglaciecola polaris LMG 21857]|uniref:Uncharacterized protein n=1 Tax=Paraglaciecola polaris LMG 21857 TaxID=1129793 RepID=K6ZW62_9ALTE|nr:hypothetical protein GPLA_2118 [Paraglaciecola polaris LMG 21857]